MNKAIILFAIIFSFVSCTTKTFKKLDSTSTGIHFNNKITENDSINILDLEYVYNGGGVAINDFNNDGLQDVFFTGNQVGNMLYLNKGDMKFTDVTAVSGVAGKDKWNSGVATVDINNDGWMDIYVCATISADPQKRANRLFINKGLNKDGVPTFVDEAKAYNVADTGYSTTAAFFDYDNDGDLDLYVLTNKMAVGADMYPNQYHKKIVDGSSPTTDHLYRNDWDSVAKHPVFTDVSKQAGILIEGYGLGLNICDINKDGWKDIYVTNDFLTNDLLWINNGNGTFTNRAAESFKHTSYSAMGNDVVDINNDGLPDVIAVDMLPATNTRKKMMTPANSYQTYMNNEAFGYEYQYGRNTLQINQGMVPNNDSLKSPVFSDVAYFAGVAETDWSWAPLVTDFDNDGLRDIVITNGFPKDITDRDFMTYRVNATSVASKEEILDQIPQVKLHNYAFKNKGNLSFADVSKDWGLEEPTFSSGAAYGDLDNDGDLDIVINNTNDEALIYQNNTSKSDNHYLNISFQGEGFNRNGIGAWAEIYYNKNNKQVYENSSYRGYLSSVQAMAHFGLGKVDKVDSVIIYWPNNRKQVINNPGVDKLLKVSIANADKYYSFQPVGVRSNTLFRDITDSLQLHYVQKEIDFPDFNVQKLLPHKLSEYGPGMAVGDIDKNGLEDIVLSGSFSYSATLLFQQPDGKFIPKDLIPGASTTTKVSEDLGLLLYDADNDGDLDLYIASGSYENTPNSESYKDKFFVNDGKGNYKEDSTAIPKNLSSKSCVRAVDYDKDGDLDLFLAGRVEPWSYPKPVSSCIYRNDTKGGLVKFTDVTEAVAPSLKNIGLVCDAVWTDFNNDGWSDLILVGEWMSMQLLKNEKGVFKNVSATSGIDNKKGWWNSIAPGDFDNDGDIDYIIGNVGQNSFYRVSPEYPGRIYAKDFNNDGNYDAIPSLYLQDDKGNKKEFPAQTRDDLIKQMIAMRGRFQIYRTFSQATMDKLLTKEELQGALILQANDMQSSFMKNLGNGKFELVPLPLQAQLSTVNGMVVGDFDGDGNLDVVMNTNDYGTEVSIGRYDALNGLFLKGDGKGSFVSLPLQTSGIYIPGNGKALVQYMGSNHQPVLAAAQNRGPLKLFALNKPVKLLPVSSGDAVALITYKNGKVQRQEFYYGSSFLSQSSRYLQLGNDVSSVELIDFKGYKKKVKLM